MPVQTFGSAFDVTPNNNVDLPNGVTGIYVGGTGHLRIQTLDGAFPTFSAVPVGTVIPVQIRRVMASGTSATLLVALTG
jgi:hypothetical protein